MYCDANCSKVCFRGPNPSDPSLCFMLLVLTRSLYWNRLWIPRECLRDTGTSYWWHQGTWCNINSLAPGKFEQHFRYLLFQIISVTDGWGISCKLALRWMSLDLTDDKSTLVQVMAWCHQATRHYLSEWWPKPLSPYGVTRPQWVKMLSHQYRNFHHKDKTISWPSYSYNHYTEKMASSFNLSLLQYQDDVLSIKELPLWRRYKDNHDDHLCKGILKLWKMVFILKQAPNPHGGPSQYKDAVLPV